MVLRDAAGRGPDRPSRRGTATTPERRRRRPLAVELELEVVDPATGVRHRRTQVDDGHRDSPTRARTQRQIAHHDEVLRRNPQWRGPEVVDGELLTHNEASRWFYASPALREWRRELVPTASALYPIQHPTSDRLPSGAVVDEHARAFFTDTLDSIGVRTRAVLLQDAVRRSEEQRTARDGAAAAPLPWVSLACGAAVPVLDALRDPALSGRTPVLRLVDHDPEALRFAGRLAAQQGLRVGEDVQLLQRDLVAGMVARDTLVSELGEGSAVVVDAVGIFEYFRDAACVRLLRNAHRLLAPGGVLVVANMLADRPELDFNRRGAGWPRLYPRSVDALVDLVRTAGLPLDLTTVTAAQDGVYAVVDVRA